MLGFTALQLTLFLLVIIMDLTGLALVLAGILGVGRDGRGEFVWLMVGGFALIVITGMLYERVTTAPSVSGNELLYTGAVPFLLCTWLWAYRRHRRTVSKSQS